MNTCTFCNKDYTVHSKKQWKLHQGITLQKNAELCTFCGKQQKVHTQKLWEMHKLTVQKAPRGKLWPLQIGFGRKGPAVVVGEFVWKNQIVNDLKPIYMACSECGHYLGSIEEDNADVLDGMCLECLSELTGQKEEQERLEKTGSISRNEFDRRMALNNTKKSKLNLGDPKTWSDSFKEWHYKFIRKHCDHEKHCRDCKYCKKEWFVKNSQGVYPYAPFKQKVEDEE